MSYDLKDIQKEIKQLEVEIRDNDQIADDMHLRREALDKKLRILKDRLRDTFLPDLERIHISDHAILRYLERAHFIDLNEVRAEMRAQMAGAENLWQLQSRGFAIRGGVEATYVNPEEMTQGLPGRPVPRLVGE